MIKRILICICLACLAGEPVAKAGEKLILTAPVMISGTKDSDTQLTLSFSESVQVLAANPGDFNVKDCDGIIYAVSAIADGTAGDSKIILTVADLSSATGNLLVTYTNNNSEVKDLDGNDLDTDNIGISVSTASGTYDLSAASYDGDAERLYVASTSPRPYGLTFGSEGTKLFVAGGAEKTILEYDLTSPYDVSSAIYAGDSEKLKITEQTTPSELVFNNDGTRMIMLGRSTNGLFEYTLTTPFDVSTATSTGVFRRTHEDFGEYSPFAMDINDTGSKLFVAGFDTDKIFQYDLSTNFDLSTASLAHETKALDFSGIDGFIGDFAFSDDGLTIFILGIATSKVYQFSLSTAYDLSTATNTNVSFDVSALGAEASGLSFNKNGTKLFIIEVGNGYISQYSVAAGDFDPPSIVSATKDSNTQITLNLNETTSISNTTAANFTVTDGTGSVYNVTSTGFNAAADDQIVLTVDDLSTVIGDLKVAYSRANGSTIKDAFCNIMAASTSAATLDIDTTPPTMVSAYADGPNAVMVTFSEPVVPDEISYWFYLFDPLHPANRHLLATVTDEVEFDNKLRVSTPGSSNNTNDFSFFHLGYQAQFGAIRDFGGNVMEDDPIGVDIIDVPKMVGGLKLSETEIRVGFVGNVKTNGGNPGDFTMTDGLGNVFPVIAQNDGFAVRDKFIQLVFNDLSTAVGDFVITYVNAHDEITSLDGNSMFTDLVGVGVNADQTAPILTGAVIAGPTQIRLLFNEIVQVLGTNPGDFVVTDDDNNVFAVSAIADGTAQDKQAILTVADLTTAVGNLSIAYTNNNNEVSDFGGNSLQTSQVMASTQDTEPPVLARVVKLSDTELILYFNEPVKIADEHPEDFGLIDCNGTSISASQISDEVIGDNRVTLTFPDLNTVVKQVYVTYTNNNDEVTDLGDNSLATDLVGQSFLSDEGVYDVREMSYDGDDARFEIGGQVTSLGNITFSEDGTKMFVIDTFGKAILEYDLPVPYEVSGALYAGDSEKLDMTGQPGFQPYDVVFNKEGTLMLVVAGNSMGVYEYSLSTGFDISTATYTGKSLDIAELNENILHALRFDDTGLRMYLLGGKFDHINEYRLTVPYDISTASWQGLSEALKLNSWDTQIRNFVFSANGKSIFILGTESRLIRQRTLDAPFDVSTGTFTARFDIRDRDSRPYGLVFNGDGSKLYLSGDTNDYIESFTTLSGDFSGPVMTAVTKDSDTQITVTFNENVSSNGMNPGDFALQDGFGNPFAVTNQSDGTPGDKQVVLTVADISGAVGDITVTYANNNNEISDFFCNVMETDATGVSLNLDATIPTILSAAKDNNTQITLTFSEAVQTNGTNPADFEVLDGTGTAFAVSQQADGTAADDQIILTVADLSTAIGDLTVNYVNNNGEIFDFGGNELATTATGPIIDTDVSAPTMVGAVKDNDTQITLTFSEAVQTEEGNPTDFSVTDGIGTSFQVIAQSDGTAHDGEIVLTVSDLSEAVGDLTITYTNNHNEIKDFGANLLSTDLTGVIIDTDMTSPTILGATRNSDTQLTVKFSEPVQTSGGNPGDFLLKDSQGTFFAVTAQTDVTPLDEFLVLTVADISGAVGTLTLTYADNSQEISDFGGNDLLTDATGVSVNLPPVATAVTISGEMTTGETLTATYTYTDSENDPESDTSYQWYRSDDASGTNKIPIGGATGTTYTLQLADFNKYISFEVTPADELGFGVPVVTSLEGPVRAPLNITLSQAINVDCKGDASGEIDISVTGGSTPYTYAWSTGATTEDLSGLVAGSYTVTVTDLAARMLTKAVEITEPADALQAVVSETSSITCYGGSQGSAQVVASGGTAPYTYLWSSGSITALASNLTAGTHTVTVTDAKGCDFTTNITLNEPDQIIISSTLAHVTCFGENDGTASVNVSGGTAPYSFVWDHGPTTQNIDNLIAGTYNLTVTDNEGCTATSVVTIVEPAQLVVSIQVDQELSCLGASDARLTAQVTGGTLSGGDLDYSYAWNDPAGTSTGTVNGLAAGTYQVTVTDSEGCTAVASATILPGVEPKVTGVSDDIGISNSDGKTNDNTLIIGGTARANIPVEVFLDGVSIGNTTADNSGSWQYDYTGTALPDGSYTITASANGQCTSEEFDLTLNQSPAILESGIKEGFSTIRLQLSGAVMLNNPSASDFQIVDCAGTLFNVLAVTDDQPGDNELVLTVEDFSTAAQSLTITYTAGNQSVIDEFGNIVPADASGINIGLNEAFDLAKALSGGVVTKHILDVFRNLRYVNDIEFGDEGKALFVLAYTEDERRYELLRFDMAVPYDLQTLSYDISKTLALSKDFLVNYGNHSFTFSKDGHRLFFFNERHNSAHSLELATAYTPTSLIPEQTHFISLEQLGSTISIFELGNKRDIVFSPDGMEMFLLLSLTDGSIAGTYSEIVRFDLLTPYDITVLNTSVQPAVRSARLPLMASLILDPNNPGQVNVILADESAGDKLATYNLADLLNEANPQPLVAYTLNYYNDAQDLAYSEDGNSVFILSFGIDEYKVNNTIRPKLTHAARTGSDQITLSFDKEIFTNGLNPEDFSLTDCSGTSLSVSEYEKGSESYTVLLTVPNLDQSTGTLQITYENNHGNIFDKDCNKLQTDLNPVEIYGNASYFNVHLAVNSGIEQGFQLSDNERNWGLQFNNDGTKMFVSNLRSSRFVISVLHLDIPFDVSSAYYGSPSEHFDDPNTDFSTRGFGFDPDGYKLFISDLRHDRILEYQMSSPYDLPGAQFVQSLDLEETFDRHQIEFSDDGLTMFLGAGLFGAYALETPYDLTNATLTGYAENIYPDYYQIAPGGRRIVVEYGGELALYEASTPFDFLKAKQTKRIGRLDISNEIIGPIRGLSTNNDGTKVFVLDNASLIHEYMMPVIPDSDAPRMKSALINDGERITITFNEAVISDGIGPSDFKVTDQIGRSFQVTGLQTVSGESELELTVQNLFGSIGDITVTYNKSLSEIADLNCNTLQSDLFGVLIEPQSVDILRQSPLGQYLNTQSAKFKVVFQDIPFQVDATDFELVPGLGITGTILGTTQLSDRQFEVEVTNISGDGLVRLRLKEDNDIVDDKGHPLISRLSYEESYIFSNSNPGGALSSGVSGLVTTSPIAFDLCFDQEVVGFEAADLSVTNGTASLNGLSFSLNHQFTFGSFGTAPYRVNQPRGVEIDVSGNVFLLDFGNARIQKFDASGTFAGQLNVSGTEPGEFNVPYSIDVGPLGRLYVSDRDNHRVQVFDNDLNFLFTFGSNGTGNGQFKKPQEIEVSERGLIYVFDATRHDIQVFDQKGIFLWKFGSAGNGDGEFNLVEGMDISDSLELYTADFVNDVVQVFDLHGNFIRKFGVSGLGAGEFKGLIDLVLVEDYVVTLDFTTSRLQYFEQDGTFVSELDVVAAGGSALNFPGGLSVSDDLGLYVVEFGAHQMQKFQMNKCYGLSITPAASGAVSVSLPGNTVTDLNGNGNSASNVLNWTFTNLPTDITLNSTSILENNAVGDPVGTLTTIDADGADTHSYSLVPGAGDTDNASFQIAGDELQAAEAFDLETKGSYNIRIKTTDNHGGEFEKTFTITIDNVPEADLRITGDLTIPATPLGISSTFDITVHNDGDATLTVSSISYPTGFGGPVLGITVAPMSMQVVTMSFTPLIAQTYSGDIVLTSNGGTGTLSVTADGSVITGLDQGQLSEETIEIYPNPADRELTLDLSELGGKPVDISFYDVNGTPLLELKAYDQSQLVIDVSTYLQGMYLVRFAGGNSVVNKKVMIRR